MAAVEVKILKKHGLKQRSGRPSNNSPPRGTLRDRLLAELEAMLPADAVAFAVGEGGNARSGLPAILIVHRGRALALETGHSLSDAQRCIFPRLKAAGMRIEIAHSFAHALEALFEMGLDLTTRKSLNRQIAELFRNARRDNS